MTMLSVYNKKVKGDRSSARDVGDDREIDGVRVEQQVGDGADDVEIVLPRNKFVPGDHVYRDIADRSRLQIGLRDRDRSSDDFKLLKSAEPLDPQNAR